MSWLAELAGKAETLLNNIDEQTGAALRHHNVPKYGLHNDPPFSTPKKKPQPKSRKFSLTENRTSPPLTRKSSPQCQQAQSTSIKVPLVPTNLKKRTPSKQSQLMFNLENCPRTLVGDVNSFHYQDRLKNSSKKLRRNSFPTDLEIIAGQEAIKNMQDLEVENVMLRNELNVVNREVSGLVSKCHKVEDGNDDVVREDYNRTSQKLEICERLNHTFNLEKESLTSQLHQLKDKIHFMTSYEIQRYKENYDEVEKQNSKYKNEINDLEIRLQTLKEKIKENENVIKKMELDYRHAQTRLDELQTELEKSQNECKQLEKDWETYKLRVKSMLQTKDNEINQLKDGSTRTEENNLLMEEITKLKEERDDLSSCIVVMRKEYEQLVGSMSQVETKCESAEKVVAALRDALKGEWAARSKAETQCIHLAKELKTLQTEAGQTITSLRLALRDKEAELTRLQETTSCSVRTVDTSALNVADYGTQDTIDNEKIQYLTQLLVQKQEKIDAILAEKNTMRIHFDKLESKYKSELSSYRVKTSHSVVQVPDGDVKPKRQNANVSLLEAASNRIGVFIRRNPLFRLFVIGYMFCLHFWVMTVILTKAQDNYTPQYRS